MDDIKNLPNQKPVEGTDYYFNEDGLMVMTASWLRKRGYCCENGCLHCPYGFKKDQPIKPRK